MSMKDWFLLFLEQSFETEQLHIYIISIISDIPATFLATKNFDKVVMEVGTRQVASHFSEIRRGIGGNSNSNFRPTK